MPHFTRKVVLFCFVLFCNEKELYDYPKSRFVLSSMVNFCQMPEYKTRTFLFSHGKFPSPIFCKYHFVQWVCELRYVFINRSAIHMLPLLTDNELSGSWRFVFSFWIAKSYSHRKKLNIVVEMTTIRVAEHVVFKSFLKDKIFKCNSISTKMMINHRAVIYVH